MDELRHECGVVAVYHLGGAAVSPRCEAIGPGQVSRLVPRMLLDLQNRGQLSAGMSSYSQSRKERLLTYKQLGVVSEAFRLSHKTESEAIQQRLAGRAAIGHVRYATCGAEDVSYAQPFEREHLKLNKWFSFCFNGQITNYNQLKAELLLAEDNHLARDCDTEIILHALSRELSKPGHPDLADIWAEVQRQFDGAYCLAVLNAMGEMLVVRDPLGIKPMCYAFDGSFFAAASESVALLNIGFAPEQIHPLPPGQAAFVNKDGFSLRTIVPSPRRAHCFFEWVYFANVASTLDGQGVYLARKRLGMELAALEKNDPLFELDRRETIVVPVPDTSKAAADSMAYELGVPSLEGLIRNRYMGRTFIEGGDNRRSKAEAKYTPLREVLEGKRVLLVEDSIVRSTTLSALLTRLKEAGRAKEVHVRVACPPIISPCFYGIDFSTVKELFAPPFMGREGLTAAAQARMAVKLGADSLRYLPVEAISRALNLPSSDLCQACITGQYPTPEGERMYQLALKNSGDTDYRRTYEGS